MVFCFPFFMGHRKKKIQKVPTPCDRSKHYRDLFLDLAFLLKCFVSLEITIMTAEDENNFKFKSLCLMYVPKR